ncbi:MAG: 23S rRNA (guanosine(2251)-2'-O)-methyltransferase RlmB, partial [Bacteroidota bacterium]|nr:23S rRNA (guanosine(2251)-2'-O)-methyltransferase RlmB [Bacteroidota bacterium]
MIKLKPSSLITGRQPVLEALSSGRSIDKILLQRNASGDSIGEI